MSAMRLSAKMDRTDNATPWGFRMTGGKDFGAPLVIQRVSHSLQHFTRVDYYSISSTKHSLLHL